MVEVEYKKEGKQWFLRLFIDQPDGIQIEDCVRVNKLSEQFLEDMDLLNEEYTLEVSSPGIFRPLTTPEHFGRFVGEWVRVHFFQSIEGRKQARGRLIGTTDDGIQLKLVETPHELFVPYKLIAKSNLDPELEF